MNIFVIRNIISVITVYIFEFLTASLLAQWNYHQFLASEKMAKNLSDLQVPVVLLERVDQNPKYQRFFQLSSPDIDQDLLLEPFRQRWTRELVYRSIVSHPASDVPAADVYYTSPSGKKLRSRIEIDKYLRQNNLSSVLSVKNFSFAKLLIEKKTGLETTRQAHLKGFAKSETSRRNQMSAFVPKKMTIVC